MHFPSGLEVIDAGAFYGDTSLTSVRLPATVVAIAHHAFYGCKNLAEVTIAAHAAGTHYVIGDNAFAGMPSMNPDNIRLGAGVVTVGEDAFVGATLPVLAHPRTECGSCAECPDAKHISIPTNSTAVGASAFAGCRALASVVVPSSVTSGYPETYDEIPKCRIFIRRFVATPNACAIRLEST